MIDASEDAFPQNTAARLDPAILKRYHARRWVSPHIAVGRGRTQQVHEVLLFDRIRSVLDCLQKEGQERVRTIRFVAVEIAKNGERYNPLQQTAPRE